MNITIVYFSGTGNTKAVANVYQQFFERLGHNVTLHSIEEKPLIGDHDLLIVGGPIYAGNMPDELISWVRQNIPKTKFARAIVYSTSAGLANANGVKSIGKKLSKKGYQIIDQLTLEMPRNFYIDKYDPTPLEKREEQFKNMVRLIRESIDNLNLKASIDIKDSTITIDFFADLFRIMAKQMGKQFKINDNCVQCGICEKDCPKSNIKHITKEYSNKCILCTRCIHNCPVNAISYKGKTIEQYKPLNENAYVVER